MYRFRQHPLVQTLVLPLTLLLFLSACTQWATIEGQVNQYIQEKQPGKVRVTLPGDTVVQVWGPSVEGDTLVGLDSGKYSGQQPDSVSVLLPQAIKVEAREAATGNTIVLVALMTIVVGGIVAAAISLSNAQFCC